MKCLKSLNKIWKELNKTGKLKELINEFLRSVLGKDINDIVDAYILAPDMHFGGIKSWLVWGHDAGLNEPNFDLTYIIHEYSISYLIDIIILNMIKPKSRTYCY